MSESGRLLGYVVTETSLAAGDGFTYDATRVAAVPEYGTEVIADKTVAERERDRLAGHAQLDADVSEPPVYVVAEVRSLP